ncbi:ATP-dependent DNA ligase [Cohnella sp. CFH 77786]|uniref:ATP-dependent DNA ligase n=1 Tax=Cohnella sp. CFH 77786 TaxID=2662265 RepID=UPI001C60FD81|nr:ATP-dependent DNA ligase [Cohnella sp. CFH 77786]MBW5447826.1 ATP-dependent DNA ligase [Cohnella sp. CFH 77786]
MFLPPMLLEKQEKPFDDDRYLFEPKIDGHRMIVSIENGKTQLFTRSCLDVTAQYPELHNVPIEDNSDAVLDGEVACVNPDTGTIDFELIQKRFLTRKPMAIMQARVRRPAIFFAFDLLRYKGEDLRGRPLTDRKALLARVLDENHHFSRVIHVEGSGVSMFEAICEKRLEGMVAKKKDSRYFGRRDPAWIKIIHYQYADVTIAGYRKNQFGWLLQHQGIPLGVMELAVPSAHRNAFYGVSKSIVTGEDRNFVYVQPSIKARVRFRNWTRAGTLRSPEFVEFVV